MRTVRHLALVLLVLLLTLGTLGAATASAKTKLALTTNFATDDPTYQVLSHPRSFHIASADATLYFGSLRWHHWGKQHTYARGKARWCEDSPCESDWSHVTIRASSPQKYECPGRWYTSARYKMQGFGWSDFEPVVCA
jgi:hypothetical protein